MRSNKSYLRKTVANPSLPANDARLEQVENELFADKPLSKKETKKLFSAKKRA